MARCSARTWQGLPRVALLTAVILTTVVGAERDSALPTTYQQPTGSASTPAPAGEPTEEVVSGESCRQQILQANDTMHYPYVLSDCEHVCGDIQIEEKQLDWIRLRNYGNQTFKCLVEFPEFRDRISQDIFWLTSSGLDEMLYLGNSSHVVLTWDYLTEEQKAFEAIVLLLCLVSLVLMLVGNLLVIATMVSSSDNFNSWHIVRTFLALTDLLRGVFVVTLSIHNSVSLMTSPLTYFNPSTITYASTVFGVKYEPLIVSGGYSSFCAIVFEITTIMSLQCLAWLAFERLLMCKCSQAKKFMAPPRVKSVVLLMWLIAITFPLVIFFGDKSCSVFDPVSKLTFLLPTEDHFGVSRTAFLVRNVYIISLFSFTVVASVKAMRNFHIRAHEELIELTKHSPSTQVRQQKMVDRHIMGSMTLILVAYLASFAPHFLLPIPDLRTNARFLYFVIWWVFILSSSWNWYLYNMRSNFFRNHLARLVLSFPWLPVALELRLKAKLPPTSALSPNWGPVWYELDNIIRKKSSTLRTENETDEREGNPSNVASSSAGAV